MQNVQVNLERRVGVMNRLARLGKKAAMVASVAIAAVGATAYTGCDHGPETEPCYTSDSTKDHCHAYHHGVAHEETCQSGYSCVFSKPEGASNDECESHCEKDYSTWNGPNVDHW